MLLKEIATKYNQTVLDYLDRELEEGDAAFDVKDWSTKR